MFDKSIFELTLLDWVKISWLFIIGSFINAIIINSFGIGVDSSDHDAWLRSGVKVVHDYGTGVDYLKTPEGYITPRLKAGE